MGGVLSRAEFEARCLAESSLPIDPECVNLCMAMNLVKGIQTTESCCGHGEYPFRIWFRVRGQRFLPELLYWFDICHSGESGWRVVAATDCAKSPVFYMVEGPVAGYEAAERIAWLMMEANP